MESPNLALANRRQLFYPQIARPGQRPPRRSRQAIWEVALLLVVVLIILLVVVLVCHTRYPFAFILPTDVYQ